MYINLQKPTADYSKAVAAYFFTDRMMLLIKIRYRQFSRTRKPRNPGNALIGSMATLALMNFTDLELISNISQAGSKMKTAMFLYVFRLRLPD